MAILIRDYLKEDLNKIIDIWNEVIEEGNAFTYDEPFSFEESKKFFEEQSATRVIIVDDQIAGVYVLHPNFAGRCKHIANASYAIMSNYRGQGLGEMLVKDSLKVARDLSFKILQFNAVVETNYGAIYLYKKLGFTALDSINNGFRLKDGSYANMIPFYIELD